MVEAQPVNSGKAMRCYCSTARNKDRQHGQVDFMHRTVFDFLDRPGTWELSCLQLKDQATDPFVALSWMDLHLIHNGMIEESLSAVGEADFAYNVHSYIDRALPCSFASIQAILERLVLMISQHPQSILPDSRFKEVACLSETLKDWSIDSKVLIALVMAVELGLHDFVETFLRDHDIDCSSLDPRLSLLTHALSRSPSAFHYEFNDPIMIEVLLEGGCSPNENASNSALALSHIAWPRKVTQGKVTPWLVWTIILSKSVENDHTIDDIDIVIDDSDIVITRLLLEAGADLKHLDDKLTRFLEVIDTTTNLDGGRNLEADTLLECVRQRRHQMQLDQVGETPRSKRKDRDESPDDPDSGEFMLSKRARNN